MRLPGLRPAHKLVITFFEKVLVGGAHPTLAKVFSNKRFFPLPEVLNDKVG